MGIRNVATLLVVCPRVLAIVNMIVKLVREVPATQRPRLPTC